MRSKCKKVCKVLSTGPTGVQSSIGDLVSTCSVPGLVLSTGAAVESITGIMSVLKKLRGSRGDIGE